MLMELILKINMGGHNGLQKLLNHYNDLAAKFE